MIRKYFHSKLNYFIRYGCPSMDEIESYSRQYKKRLDEVGASGEIPDDLALEVTYFKFLIAASILPRHVCIHIVQYVKRAQLFKR